MGIKVRATNPGLYGQYREPGHEFEIKEEKHFSKKWMEKVDKDSSKSMKKVSNKSDEPDFMSSSDVI